MASTWATLLQNGCWNHSSRMDPGDGFGGLLSSNAVRRCATTHFPFAPFLIWSNQQVRTKMVFHDFIRLTPEVHHLKLKTVASITRVVHWFPSRTASLSSSYTTTTIGLWFWQDASTRNDASISWVASESSRWSRFYQGPVVFHDSLY